MKRFWSVDYDEIVTEDELRKAYEEDDYKEDGEPFGYFLSACHVKNNGSLVEIGSPARFTLRKDYGEEFGAYSFKESLAGDWYYFEIDGTKEEVERYFRDTFGADSVIDWEVLK